MSRAFLCTWTDHNRELRLTLDSSPCAHLGHADGQSSLLLSATPSQSMPALHGLREIAFLVPKSSSQLLSFLFNDLELDITSSVFLSYGHASTVLLLDGTTTWAELAPEVTRLLSAYEVWTLDGSQAVVRSREVNLPEHSAALELDEIDASGVSFEASAQIRQFNANIRVLGRTISLYTPEVAPLATGLHERVSEMVDQLRGLVAGGSNRADDDGASVTSVRAEAIRQSVVLESVLVETNAVVTLYSSQLGAGTLPLTNSSFPVAEYSLLGIAVPLRAAWALYFHLAKVFAASNPAGTLSKNLPIMGGFDWSKGASTRRDFSAWAVPRDILRRNKAAADDKPRLHIPYFSSRWGYHESLHSLSLSWQSIYASAAKEWNLLTLTHEFMHSQVRAMVANIFDPRLDDGDLATELADRYERRESGANARESMQAAFVEALVVQKSMASLRTKASVPGAVDINSGLPTRVSPAQLVELYRAGSDLINEIAVHVLDFKYVYGSRSDSYISSIWNSWSLVPSVVDRVEYYVLRTLCALSAEVADPDYFTSFESARETLQAELAKLAAEELPRPAVLAAIALLESEEACKMLSLQFVGLQYMVQLTLHIFFDPQITHLLLQDSAAGTDEERFTYGIEAGQYLGIKIESPLAFLLEQFELYENRAGSEESEFAGLWQMLQLT